MIIFKKVTKKYNKNTYALKNASFQIKRGEFVILVGPSGAGKSTIAKLLTCEEKPTSGKIYIGGYNIGELKSGEIPYFRRKIGVVFQDYKLLPKKTVWENIAFALEVCAACNEEINKKVKQVLELVGLEHKATNFIEELSGGEKQRVGIARALVHGPKLLIADEPTGNLDPKNSKEIIDLLLKINQAGTIVILATHDKNIVDQLRKRVIIIRDGLIVSDEEKGTYKE
jgi:cell division transport system ATP-binding protein